MDKTTIIITSSTLNDAESCMQKYDYAVNKRLRPIETPDYLDKGTLFHLLLEIYYKGRQSEESKVDEAIIAARMAAADMHINLEEVDEIIARFKDYILHYQGDGWVEILAVEEKFSVVLFEDDSTRIVYEGKIDLAVKDIHGKTIVVDHKTGSRNKKPFLANQSLGYYHVLQPDLVVINKIGFQKDEDLRFRRFALPIVPEVANEWKNDAIFYALSILRCDKVQYYPRNRTSCDKYSGCVFRALCDFPSEMREYRIATMFREDDSYHLFSSSEEVEVS